MANLWHWQKKKDIEIPNCLSHNFFVWGQFSARVRPRHAQHVKCSEWLTYDMVLICGDMILFRYKVFEVSQTTSSTIIPQHPGLDLCDALQRHYRVHTHCCSSSDISSKVAGKYLQEAKPQIKNLPSKQQQITLILMNWLASDWADDTACASTGSSCTQAYFLLPLQAVR